MSFTERERLEPELAKLLQKHPELTQSSSQKVTSHVQREEDDWIVHTLLIEGTDVPFYFKRKKRYKSLHGARVNITYYPDPTEIAGMEFERFKIVRIKRL